MLTVLGSSQAIGVRVPSHLCTISLHCYPDDVGLRFTVASPCFSTYVHYAWFMYIINKFDEQVGSGKSSLLNLVLGEMRLISGSVHSSGSIAYVPQVFKL